MSLVDELLKEIKTNFTKNPFIYFTERDIHSDLALIAKRYLDEREALYVKTNDGYVISRVHHEYPTPFRCLMHGTTFKKITENKFKEEKLKNPKFRARRGYLDLVILNPEYISKNNVDIVSGKNFKTFIVAQNTKQPMALDLAIEIVYFSVFNGKEHEGILKRRVQSIVQDYKKLVEMRRHKNSAGSEFCKEAVMMFFTNSGNIDLVKKSLKQLDNEVKDEVKLISIIACIEPVTYRLM
jgi:hypothetical protein